MSPLIRKEVRMLLPAWMAALAAATAPLWLGRDFWGVLLYLFGAAILALVLSPFGLETSYGTFGLMLVQPEDRRHVWRIKTGLLALALASACALFLLCLWSSSRPVDWGIRPDFTTVLKISGLMMLLAFSGGLWSTLLLRDLVSGFFCTLMAPMIICAVILAALSHWLDLTKESDNHRLATILYPVLAVYAAAGFFWARWLFLRAQDVPWTGGHISLTSVRGVSLRWLAFKFTDRQNPWTALVKKELQLQEITMFLVPGLALLHLAALALRHFAPEHIPQELINVVPVIWLASVPFVIGCVTVAEERRLNTLEGLLCLPMTKRGQFAVKLTVALMLGIVLGGIIPWVLLRMGGAMKPDDFKLKYAVEITAGITAIAFYASTMSRGLLQALPTTVCIPTLAGMAIALAAKCVGYSWSFQAFLQSSLFPALALPAAIITLLLLAFNNYQRLQIGWRVWVHDAIWIVAVAGGVMLAGNMIFDRSWELFLKLEPRHGPAQITGTGRAMIAFFRWRPCILLPDGRLWVGKIQSHRTWKVSGGFVQGSNWTQVAGGEKGVVALQSDGTLWQILNSSDVRQIGTDSDWDKISGGHQNFMAIKQDGTLWGWGYSAFEEISEGKKVDYADPVRVGTNSDWANVFLIGNGRVYAVKRDGTVWKWGELFIPKDHYAGVRPVGQMVRDNLPAGDWLAMGIDWNGSTVGIRGDGSLWVEDGYIPENVFGEKVQPGADPETPRRVGTKSDWAALSGNWQQAALKANGTLLTTGYGDTKRPSKYADWLATTKSYNWTVALAKDGTLTCWDEYTINWPDGGAPFMKRFFLGPSRRPLFSINILDAQK